MLPLALILRSQGASVSGSDRSYDQGRTPEKFAFLQGQGIELFPQDGSGLTDIAQTLVVSAAVEEQVPDVRAARSLGLPILTRAEVLAELFNAAAQPIAIGGTSGKSTTTGMLGWILNHGGRQPTIVNGAVMKNFVALNNPFASAIAGAGEPFVCEVDESDGSIARFHPRIAILNNISLDHKGLDELRALFRNFVSRATTAVLNLDNEESAALVAAAKGAVTYSLRDSRAEFFAGALRLAPDGISFTVTERDAKTTVPVKLRVPGAHNVSNALAAISGARICDVTLKDAAEALNQFTGIRRRMEFVGTASGVTVIDDFAHNPDKIAATLSTLHAFPGRLLVMFQPHGYGPLRMMKDALIDCFVRELAEDDALLMPSPAYFGGTVERSVTSDDIARGVRAKGRAALALEDRAACADRLLAMARSGDRIVVMGARDDTLSTFALELLERLRARLDAVRRSPA